ncbi:unnamed protein product [Choristocarpus tenellus]
MPSDHVSLPLKDHRNHFLFSGNARSSIPDGAVLDTSDIEDSPLALVVLNTERDRESREILRHLWSQASLRLCADGGANRLYDSLEEADRTSFVPDVIVGDLDSLRPEVCSFYQGLGSKVRREQDQDHNDFEKCLVEVERLAGTTLREGTNDLGTTKCLETGFDSRKEGRGGEQGRKYGEVETVTATRWMVDQFTVVGLGAFGGRFDHEMAAMSLLHTYTARFHRLVLLGSGNIAFLLDEDHKHIICPDRRFEGPTCGLFPIGGPCQSVTTKGLQWNLEEGHLEFGILVSTSNCITGAEVQVKTDSPLVWNVEFLTAEWLRIVSG